MPVYFKMLEGSKVLRNGSIESLKKMYIHEIFDRYIGRWWRGVFDISRVYVDGKPGEEFAEIGDTIIIEVTKKHKK